MMIFSEGFLFLLLFWGMKNRYARDLGLRATNQHFLGEKLRNATFMSPLHEKRRDLSRVTIH